MKIEGRIKKKADLNDSARGMPNSPTAVLTPVSIWRRYYRSHFPSMAPYNPWKSVNIYVYPLLIKRLLVHVLSYIENAGRHQWNV